MDENLITITNNENPTIELEIGTYTNEIDIEFVQPVDLALSIHNRSENAHSNILAAKANVSTTYTKTEVNNYLNSKLDKLQIPISINSNYSIGVNDFSIFANATSGAFNITLPSASENSGKEIFIKKIDTSNNLITLMGTIDGEINPTLGPGEDDITIISNGTSWLGKGF